MSDGLRVTFPQILEHMIAFPPCKINLGLHITEKRPDGYHNIETVFYAVPWCDALEVAEADVTSLTIHGMDIPGSSSDNLIMKAYQLLKKDFDLPPVAIHLLKHIPFGAGLGGGSSDGAWMFKLLNDHFGLHLADQTLANYASQIGSDCAFFIYGKPMLGIGKGDELSPIALSLKGKWICVAWPGFGVPTQEAYAGVTPQKPSKPLAEVIRQPLDTWQSDLTNQFADSVIGKYPQIGALKTDLLEAGAIYAEMSGSGAAVFGIFEQEPTLGFPKGYKSWTGMLE